MKKTFIVANWKSNMTTLEANNWLQEISNFQFPISNKEIIVCPPFTLLWDIRSYLSKHNFPIKIGAQDVSPFDQGAYTGEINGKQLKEFVEFVIVGHSERRINFNEDNNILEEKVEMARKYSILPIFCIQDKNTQIPKSVEVVAYEPVFAIGTGTPDTPENAEQVAKYVKENARIKTVLYGGSVTPKNVKKFTQVSTIDGVLVGGASLYAQEFLAIIKNA